MNQMKWIYSHPRVYDFVDWFVSFSMSGRARRKAIGNLVTDSFLEIGAGSGKSFCLVDSKLMIGLDRSAKMLRYAKRRFPEIVVVIGDAHSLPFRDSCIDVSVFSYCMRGLATPGEALKEALRVSSRVVIIDYSKPAFLPAIRPKTQTSRREFPMRRFSPWIPPVTSPATKRPGITVSQFALNSNPPFW